MKIPKELLEAYPNTIWRQLINTRYMVNNEGVVIVPLKTRRPYKVSNLTHHVDYNDPIYNIWENGIAYHYTKKRILLRVYGTTELDLSAVNIRPYELFVDIEGTDGVLMVSNYKRIITLAHNKVKLVFATFVSGDVEYYDLYKNNEMQTLSIDDIVAEAFADNPKALYWGDASKSDSESNSIKKGHAIRCRETGEEFVSISSAARRYGVSDTTIHDHINRDIPFKNKGDFRYTFEYITYPSKIDSFGDKLKMLRKQEHKTQSEVADAVGTNQRSLSGYEKDERTPDIIILRKIAKYFNVSTDYLLGVNDVIENNAEEHNACEYSEADEYNKTVKEDKHMNIKRGEIYYVNKMPVVGAEHEAGRPAVVVSTDRHNAKSGTIEVVYLTTRSKGMMPEHIFCSATGTDSTILCEQITTVSVDRLSDYITTLTEEEMLDVEAGLLHSLGMESYIPDEHEDDKPDDEPSEAPVIDADVHRITMERDFYKQMYESLLEKIIK